MKQLAVPFIAFIDITGKLNAYEKIEPIQKSVSATGAGQLLQDEQIEPEFVDAPNMTSVLDLKQLAKLQALPELLTNVKSLLAATDAPWRTLADDPEAMKHIERLQAAATQVRASVARISL